VPLLSVFPPLRISVCKLLVSGSLHFAIYLRRPGEGNELPVRVGECVEEGGREESRRKNRRGRGTEGVRERANFIASTRIPRPLA